MKSLSKYRIGLLVLGILTLGLAVYVVMGASNNKADLETKKAADKIAEQLNKYVFAAGAPKSLAAAGIENVPDEVKYTKLSDSQYRFCVTYKAANSGFDANTAAQQAALGLATGMGGGFSSFEEAGYLYLPSTHKKGENCQTVTLPTPGVYDPVPSPGLEGSTPSNLDGLEGTGSGDSLNIPSTEMPDSYQYPVQ